MTVQYGTLPFDEAIRFFQDKDLVPTERWADLWKEGHDTGFAVAGAMKADLLADLKDAVAKARGQGITLVEFRKEFERIVARRGWTGWTGEGSETGRAWRARVIYDTNLTTAYSAGRWAQARQVKATRPYLLYQHSDVSVTPRPLHVKWSGLVVAQDDPWVHAHWPPNGWGCKCRMFSLSQADMDRRGLKVQTPPDDGTRRWVDKATGEVVDVPNGIDPGFDYTPGASLSATVRQQLEGKAKVKNPIQPTGAFASAEDVDRWMAQVAKHRPEWFRAGHGYQSTKIETGERYFMATYGDGRFLLVDESFPRSGGFSPKRDLFSALSKLAGQDGQGLSFHEEYAVESWWHEINHNRQKGLYSVANKKPGDIRKVVMETVNQFVSRHTYADFLQALGGKAVHAEKVLADGYGYGDYLRRFNQLLGAVGVDPNAMVDALQAINFESLDMGGIVGDVAAAIAKEVLGGDARGVKTAGKDVERVLRAIKKPEFADLLAELGGKKWVQSTSTS